PIRAADLRPALTDAAPACRRQRPAHSAGAAGRRLLGGAGARGAAGRCGGSGCRSGTCLALPQPRRASFRRGMASKSIGGRPEPSGQPRLALLVLGGVNRTGEGLSASGEAVSAHGVEQRKDRAYTGLKLGAAAGRDPPASGRKRAGTILVWTGAG